MGILEDLSNKAGSSQAASELKNLLLAAGAKADDLDIQIDPSTGAARFEGREFVWDNGLHLIGVCPVCRMDQPSRLIRSVADIGPLLRFFKPARHDCMDVD